jgi:uncharacterized protein YoxC
MANHDIQDYQHLLNQLNEKISFLDSLMAQTQIASSKVSGLISQVRHVSSEVDQAWASFHVAYEKLEKRR